MGPQKYSGSWTNDLSLSHPSIHWKFLTRKCQHSFLIYKSFMKKIVHVNIPFLHCYHDKNIRLDPNSKQEVPSQKSRLVAHQANKPSWSSNLLELGFLYSPNYVVKWKLNIHDVNWQANHTWMVKESWKKKNFLSSVYITFLSLVPKILAYKY